MKKIYDVIVAGAGPSGLCAAVSAARNGLEVLLVTKDGVPGGMNVAAMVHPIMTFHAGEHQIIRGIAQEIIDRLMEKGGTLGHLPDPIGVVSTITPIDPALLSLVYFEILEAEPNITSLFHSFVCDVDCTAGVVKSITVVNKSGRSVHQARAFIDATGDGDIAAMSKAPFAFGRSKDGMSQPMSLMYSMGNVNLSETVDYVLAHPEQFILDQSCDLRKYLAVCGFFSLIKHAEKNGDYTLPRDRVLFFQGVHPGEVLINMTRIIKLSGVNAKDLTRAEFIGRQQVANSMEFLKKYIPGFANAYLLNIGSVIGVRESRRIEGIKTLTESDVINNVKHSDSVAVGAFPIDIHDPVGSELAWVKTETTSCYDIPYGVMVPRAMKNLLVTGRCISASHEALASARISATAMALGEAAGVAAAQCVKAGKGFADADIPLIQQQLLKQGAIISRP